jgi:hypothetical protein
MLPRRATEDQALSFTIKLNDGINFDRLGEIKERESLGLNQTSREELSSGKQSALSLGA